MIKAVVFDYGRVILNINFSLATEHWACHTEDFYQPQVNAIHHQFERGQIDADSFFEELRLLLQLEVSQDEFNIGWNKILLDYVPGVIDCIHQVRRNLPVYLFSNTNTLHHQVFSRHKQMAVFERCFYSHEMGCRKPEASAYAWVTSHLDLQAHEVLFFDDLGENVQAARQFGWQAHRVLGVRSMETILQDYGILAGP